MLRMSISARTKEDLFRAAGSTCAICHRSLILESDGREGSHIAEMAHIVAQKPGGPRGGEPRPSEIDGVDNLILLCPSDHRMIDKLPFGPRLYPVATLRALKAEHEAWIEVDRRRPEPLQDDSSAVRAPVPVRAEEIVAVGGERYRLCALPEYAARSRNGKVPDRIEGSLVEQWSHDGGAVRCQGHAYREDGEGGHVWLRRVSAHASSAEGALWRRAVVDEAAVLVDRLPALTGLPSVLAVEATPTDVALVTGLPSVTSIDDFFADRGRSAAVVRVLFTGLETLCTALGALHDAGLAHRALHPGAILIDRRGRLHLRDLGRATDSAAGQSTGDGAEDVRALAEIVFFLITGSPPLATGPQVSASALNPVVPDRASAALIRALSAEPRERGDVRRLGRELRAALRVR
ncbi:HNH endonuclease [Actinocrinis puniceicyclus]|uniref:HNH endonuclease n=1 Tax=Actinocrinis puniceicyclus TaxID=977794 RepID=A0A8J8BHP5_9ACTN|nr:HNH endonuclease [Actinocrinis puniceicyclus]MBS2967044.1 HNH endonuclease [Actinocrinis puniceicyclus]